MYINVEIYIYKQPHKLHPNIVQNKTDKANFNTHPNRLDGFHKTLLPITCNLKIRFSNKLSSFCVSRHLRFRQPQKLRCKTNGDFSSTPPLYIIKFLLLSNSFYFYNLPNNFCSWILKNEIIK